MKKDYELSNISYTNKDFFDVYPELLQLAKRLSAKWDPTVSNESDPGVVLIKELALITDKINYIADKYALENNPRSVTQIENARQLYNLLGYYPEWYQSAKVNVSMYWDGEKESNSYIKVPKYTALQDADGEFTYTTLNDVVLPMDGSYASGEIEAIEGSYNRLVVNNSDIITLSMLSDDQRIYINDYNVAMNGIFVTDATGTIPWTQVKNINIVESYTRSYSFNVDIVTGQCYLQFPRDIAYLIGDGLIVHYILSKGKEGNIPINHLTKLAITTLSTTDLEGQDVSVDCENIKVTNTGNTFRGKDPVGIDEMYENWKHIAGTFDTLVTLRDYCNAVRRYPDLASNGFVTDRTNDVQLSYKVMTGTPELPTTKIKIEKYDTSDLYDPTTDYNGDHTIDEDDKLWYTGKFQSSMYNNKITPYDLKLYCLKAFPYDSITNYPDYNSTFELYSDADVDITDSDTRKMIDALNTFKCISHDFYLPQQEKICFLKNKYNVDLQILPNQDLTSLQALEMKQNICRAIYTQFNANKVEFGEGINYDDLLECIKNSDNRIKTAILDRLTYDTYAVFYVKRGGNTLHWFEVPVSDDAYNEFIKTNGDSLFRNTYQDGYSDYKDMWKDEWKRLAVDKYCKQFRKEIVAKNILAGITPYIVDVGGGYPYSFTNKAIVDTSADHVKTNLSIKMKFDQNKSVQTVTLKENEVLQFTKPNLLDLRTYGAYIYYEYVGKAVEAGKDYTLGSDECIAFFYKEADKDSKYRFDLYGPGTIIHPEFPLQSNRKDIIDTVFGSLRPTEVGECLIRYKALPSVKQYTGLSVNQSVVIKKINQITLPRKSDAEAYIYFVTKDSSVNTATVNTEGKYILSFDSNGRRILDEGEFFIYTNSSKTSLDILGAGTEIRWMGKTEPVVLLCDRVDTSEIAMYGSTVLKGKWLTIKDPTKLFIVEKSFTNALEGDSVEFTLKGSYDEANFTIDSSGLISDENIFTYDLSMYKMNDDLVEESPIGNPVAVAQDGITKSVNLMNFVDIIYRGKTGFTNTHSDRAALDCVQIRGVNEEDEYSVISNNLFAWKCIGIDGQRRWIYDSRTYAYLFLDDNGNFSEDKYNQYKKLLGLTESDNVAGVGSLTTITDMTDVVAGADDTPDTDIEDDIQYRYDPTDEELEAFRSWESLFVPTSGWYLQYYINYGDLSDSQITNSRIYIDYTFTKADEDAPLNRFDVKINGEPVDISPSDDIATELNAYLNIDVGPDKPQVLRADMNEGEPWIVDQMQFYLANKEVSAINTNLSTAKDITLYSNVNVYGQGSQDQIDVRYYDEHLQLQNPIFYGYESLIPASAPESLGGVTYYTEQGNNHFIAFDKRNPDPASWDNPGSTEWKDNPRNSRVEIFKDITLPQGHYILKVAHSNSCLDKLYLLYANSYTEDTKMKILGDDDDDPNLAEPKTYYMTFDAATDGEGHTLRVQYLLKNPTEKTATAAGFDAGDYKYGDVFQIANDVDPIRDVLEKGIKAHEYVICTRDKYGEFSWSDWAVTPFPLYDLALTPLTKFEFASDLSEKDSDYYNLGDDNETLYDELKKLDYDDEFNYLYEIPGNKLIKNPLKATSFLNTNHVYNQFTICESKLPDILV